LSVPAELRRVADLRRAELQVESPVFGIPDHLPVLQLLYALSDELINLLPSDKLSLNLVLVTLECPYPLNRVSETRLDPVLELLSKVLVLLIFELVEDEGHPKRRQHGYRGNVN